MTPGLFLFILLIFILVYEENGQFDSFNIYLLNKPWDLELNPQG